MTDRATPAGCPGAPKCPLYVLSHDASTSHLGCVSDLAEPCAGQGSPAGYEALFLRAVAAIFARWRM